MTVRPLLTYPDPRLRQVASPVTRFDAELRGLAADLLDTMHAAPGIGITAPHIGIAQRLVVLDLPDGGGPRTYVNPRLLWASDDKVRHLEGSVSMPGATEEIERAARVRIAWQDLDGTEQIEETEGLAAICHQHEIEQLDGVFWLQRLSKLRRDMLIRKWQKGRRGG